MRLSEFVQKGIKDSLVIFALIIIIITVTRQIYYPSMDFDLNSIYIIMAFSFISALIGFTLYSPNDVSENKMRIRIAIHFFTLEIILILLASIFGIVEGYLDVIILAVEIAIVYVLVRLLSWQRNKKEAKEINEKLKAFKKEL